MTRGRKKDLTIPPSRTLVQQRDYRARKANYVATLEERCRKTEEENAMLRMELVEARARLVNPALLLPETAQASSDLLRNLQAAAASLAKFQDLAFSATNNRLAQPESPQLSQSEQTSGAAQLHPYFHENMSEFSQRSISSTTGRKRLFIETTPPFSPQSAPRRSISPHSSNSISGSEECCGGIIDCDALDCDGILEHDPERGPGKISRLSGMRSTSDHRLQSS